MKKGAFEKKNYSSTDVASLKNSKAMESNETKSKENNSSYEDLTNKKDLKSSGEKLNPTR
jgi:hypothetical protein